jgi:hypothetical protein
MKKSLIGLIILSVFVTISCNNNNEKNTEKQTASYATVLCQSAIDSARLELKKGNVFLLDTGYSYTPRMEQILNEKYQIVRDGHSPTTYDSCFSVLMDSFVTSNYGIHFMKNLLHLADSIDSLLPSYVNTDGSYNFVNNEPLFIEGSDSFKRFKNILSGDSLAKGRIVLMFQIDTSGRVASYNTLINYDYFFDSIAIYKLKKSKWTPATISVTENGRSSFIKVPFRQKITFYIRN